MKLPVTTPATPLHYEKNLPYLAPGRRVLNLGTFSRQVPVPSNLCAPELKGVRGYWLLLLETSAATRRPPLHHYYLLAICLPSFFTSSVSSCFEIGDIVKYSSDTSSFTQCLSGLFPLSDPWYSYLIAVTSAVYVHYSRYYVWFLVNPNHAWYSVGD